MQNLDNHSVPMHYLAMTLDLAEGLGIARDVLLDTLSIPAALRARLRPAPARHASRLDTVDAVRARLASSLRPPSLEALADELHLSSRTLKRHLQQRGTSYRRLLDDRRGQLSAEFLRNPSLSLESISDSLGYSSAANFSRAFRRWAGTTPGRWRTTMRSVPEPDGATTI